MIRALLIASAVAALPFFANAGESTKCLPKSLRGTLATIERKFGRVQVVSTYRRGALIAGTRHRSFHASCRAVDFNPPRGKYQAVYRWLDRNHPGGVGTYSGRMHHLHIDNGPRVRFHKRVR